MRAMPAELEPKLHLLARRLFCPIPEAGRSTSPRRCRNICSESWDFFGFDVGRDDPIIGGAGRLTPPRPRETLSCPP